MLFTKKASNTPGRSFCYFLSRFTIKVYCMISVYLRTLKLVKFYFLFFHNIFLGRQSLYEWQKAKHWACDPKTAAGISERFALMLRVIICINVCRRENS